MATSNPFTSLGLVDPSIASSQAELDRQTRYADMLRQRSMQIPTDTQYAPGGRAILRSPMEGLASLAEALAANRMDKRNDESRADLSTKAAQAYQKMLGEMLGDTGASPNAGMPQVNGADEVSAYPGQTAQPAPITQEQQIRRAAQAAMMMGNTDLANKLVGNLLEMTNDQKNMRAMGQDPALMGQLGTAAARKAGIIELQPGTTAIDLATGKERFQPTLAPGVQLNGGVASPVPGFADAQSGIAGAQARATEDAKMMEVKLPDNTTRQMTQGQYLSLMSPQGAGNPPARVAQAAAKAGDQNYAFDIGGQRGMVTGGQAPAGLGQSGDPVKLAADKSYAEGVAKDTVDQRKAIVSAGVAAPLRIAKLQQIDKLLDGFEGGSLSQAAMKFASLGNSLGLKIDPKLPDKEAAAAIGNAIALELRNPAGGAGMPGAMSDADRQFLVGMTPNLSQTAEGRRTLVKSMIAVEARAQKVADAARKYEAKYGKLDNGFFAQLQAWSDQNPLMGGK